MELPRYRNTEGHNDAYHITFRSFKWFFRLQPSIIEQWLYILGLAFCLTCCYDLFQLLLTKTEHSHIAGNATESIAEQ